MTDEVKQTALAARAAKELPARLLAGEVAKPLNCTTDDAGVLMSAGKLRALGRPRTNAVNFLAPSVDPPPR